MPTRLLALCLLGISACEGGDDPAPDLPEAPSEASTAVLSGPEALVRASMALRGMRPSEEDLARLEADPAAFDALVEGYVDSPEFLEVVKDMHAEALLLRTDTVPQLPAIGPLKGVTLGEMYASITEEPLELVAHVVGNDLPYTEIVTADYTMANEVVSGVWGLPYDPDGPEWQVAPYTDGRPAAGLLSSPKVLLRHISNASNFHRGRANMVARVFLCQDFDGRDITIPSGIDIADEMEVANAVQTNTACVGCHQALDPLAATFWGLRGRYSSSLVVKSYQDGCYWDWSMGAPPEERPSSAYCYPIDQYEPAFQMNWSMMSLRPPGYYGAPLEDLTDVGEAIASDPRFASCTAKRFFGYFANADIEDVPVDVAAELQTVFTESGFDAKALAVAAVKHPAFQSYAPSEPVDDPIARMRTIRPEQYAQTLEQLTGYRWMAAVDGPGCADPGPLGNRCWGDVDLLRSDLYGFRAMSGGVDGFYVVTPERGVTPIKLLAMSQAAWDAAAWVVEDDLALDDPAERRLLRAVEADTTDEPTVRAQLADLHLRVHGEPVAADGPDVDLGYGLFADALAHTGDPTRAWTIVIAAMLQDPRMLWL